MLIYYLKIMLIFQGPNIIEWLESKGQKLPLVCARNVCIYFLCGCFTDLPYSYFFKLRNNKKPPIFQTLEYFITISVMLRSWASFYDAFYDAFFFQKSKFGRTEPHSYTRTSSCWLFPNCSYDMQHEAGVNHAGSLHWEHNKADAEWFGTRGGRMRSPPCLACYIKSWAEDAWPIFLQVQWF